MPNIKGFGSYIQTNKLWNVIKYNFLFQWYAHKQKSLYKTSVAVKFGCNFAWPKKIYVTRSCKGSEQNRIQAVIANVRFEWVFQSKLSPKCTASPCHASDIKTKHMNWQHAVGIKVSIYFKSKDQCNYCCQLLKSSVQVNRSFSLCGYRHARSDATEYARSARSSRKPPAENDLSSESSSWN